jgi:hypothetical protein
VEHLSIIGMLYSVSVHPIDGDANVSLVGCHIYNRNSMDSIWHIGGRYLCRWRGACLFMYM